VKDACFGTKVSNLHMKKKKKKKKSHRPDGNFLYHKSLHELSEASRLIPVILLQMMLDQHRDTNPPPSSMRTIRNPRRCT